MNWKHIVSRNMINKIARVSSRSLSQCPYVYENGSAISAPISPSFHLSKSYSFKPLQNPQCLKPFSSFNRYIHSSRETKLSYLASDIKLDSEEDVEEDGTINEFLSRFVWIMRGKLSEYYVECDKQTIAGMLLVIVDKVVSEMEKGGIEKMLNAAVSTPSQDFSEDLWKTVWEVSNMVLDDMKKAIKKEKMKGFLQSEEVKKMCRFAGEIGIRGDMLRELRFKWASEKMEESEFYQSLERLREEERAHESESKGTQDDDSVGEEAIAAEEKPKVVSLPKRRGKIRYTIYGLDLSDSKWAEVADKVHETGEIIWPQEPKPISGKCKLVTEKMFSLNEADDPSPLLAEWVELLQPSRVDWINLLDRLKEKNTPLYHKVHCQLSLFFEAFGMENTRKH